MLCVRASLYLTPFFAVARILLCSLCLFFPFLSFCRSLGFARDFLEKFRSKEEKEKEEEKKKSLRSEREERKEELLKHRPAQVRVHHIKLIILAHNGSYSRQPYDTFVLLKSLQQKCGMVRFPGV